MRYKFKFAPLLLALSMLLCMLVSLTAFADEQVILPSWIYDFTTAGIYADTGGGINNLSCYVTEGSYSTLSAMGGDPQMPLTTPNIYVDTAKYLCIEYRTLNNPGGQLYVSRDDGIYMGESPDAMINWNWINDGEWHRLILYCDGWAEVEDTVFTALRFDPMILGLEECNGETIDIRFLAFFANEQSAAEFDLAAYQQYVAQHGLVVPDGVRPPSTVWPIPEYQEQTVHPDDNYAGTLKITYSEDGKYATVSYGSGENAVSYTVPNNQIYLFGGYAGTDDLDRSLKDSTQVGIVRGDRKVGITYYLWHGEQEMPSVPGVHDITKILQDSNLQWGDIGTWHWWSQPLYGYYYMDDNWVMRKHVELLMNAGIDFLCIETTALSAYTANALKLMAVLHDMNRMGFDAPKIVFRVPEDAKENVQRIYDDIYRSGFYKDTWYMQDGKPLIFCPTDADPNGYFTVTAFDFACVLAARQGGAPFSESLLYGDTTNPGRSFTGDPNCAADLAAYYQRIQNDPTLYLHGLYIAEQWQKAIDADLPLVLVGDWNKWITQRQPDTDKIVFDGGVSAEFSSDLEMMAEGYFDHYYMQLAANIQQFKGAAPIIVQDARNAINLTGSFDAWNKVQVTYKDPAKDMLDRNTYGYGNIHYVNDTGKNDIIAAKVTTDTKNVYFYVQTREEICLPKNDRSWMQLFISTGGEGWYGYDYIVNYQAQDQETTTVARYCGTDGSYAFEEIGEISYRVQGNQMMIAVPMEMLGFTNPNGIKFEFKWADSRSLITTMEQFYADGDAAPLGRLNYVFQNCIDPETAAQYVPSNSIPQPAPEKSGCKSAQCFSTAAGCLMIIPYSLLKKKNDSFRRKHA